VKELLIFEPNFRGHHLHWVRWIANKGLAEGYRVVFATTRDAIQSSEFEIHLAEIAERLTIDSEFDHLLSNKRWLPMVSTVRALSKVAAKYPSARLIIPYADRGMSQFAALMQRVGMRVLRSDIDSDAVIMRGGFAYPCRSLMESVYRQALFVTLAWVPWRRVHFIDELAFDYVMRRGGALARKSFLLPDPAEIGASINREDARRRVGIPLDGRYIGCYGLLDRRKGVDLLVRAFGAADLKSTDRLLLVGKADAAVKAEIENIKHNFPNREIIVIDRYVSEDELNAAVSALDLVCAPYPRHIGSASVVIRAAALHRPVLGHEFGWIGHAIERADLGWTCKLDELSQQLRVALDAAPNWRPSESTLKFNESRTVDSFQRALFDAPLRS
jgi:glycosyltransferase involved in cell wall biosynthesis